MKNTDLSRLVLNHKAGIIAAIVIVSTISMSVWQWREIRRVESEKQSQEVVLAQTSEVLSLVQSELETLQNSDPHKTNLDLQKRIEMIEGTYQDLILMYEIIDDFENSDYPKEQVVELRKLFANLLDLTSKREYEAVITAFEEASEAIAEYEAIRAAELLTQARAEAAKQVAAQLAAQTQTGEAGSTTTQTAPSQASNDPPSSGYSRQVVSSDIGQFTVSIVAGDLSSTRVIVDTASSSDCFNDCPVLPLGDYIARNGAYAGINGSYFCPASYPNCAGKTNSYDLLAMNKDKTYFNSDNNVYSNNPGVIFSPGSVRFIGAVSGWGRDTGIDSMLSNYPLMVSGGNVVFGGGSDPTFGVKGNRSFVSNRGGVVYIGVVHSATIAETAIVMKAMGMDNALNLDDGGSTALWFGGTKLVLGERYQTQFYLH